MFFREVGGEREQFSPNEQLYRYLEGGNRSLTEPMVHDRVLRSLEVTNGPMKVAQIWRNNLQALCCSEAENPMLLHT